MTGFHIDKSISIGHIITTFSLLVGLVVWGMRTETKIELNSALIQAQEQRIDREVMRTAAESAQIRQSLARIEDKIDRWVERERQ